MVKKGLSLGICLLLMVGLLAALHTPARAAPEAIITLNPGEGFAGTTDTSGTVVPGTVVTISGSGFAPDSTITVTWNSKAIATDPATVTTDGNGDFSCKITVPDTLYGEYAVVATDSAHNSAGATFYVLPSAGEKVWEGIKASAEVMIAIPVITSEILSDFFDLGHLRLTDRGNEFVANMVSVISNGVKYAAQWLTEKLGG